MLNMMVPSYLDRSKPRRMGSLKGQMLIAEGMKFLTHDSLLSGYDEECIIYV